MHKNSLRREFLQRSLCTALAFFGILAGPVPAAEPWSGRRTTVDPTDIVTATPFIEYQQLSELLKRKSSTDRLLDFTEDLYLHGRLSSLGTSSLRWTFTVQPGWRWETTDATGVRTVLAVEGPLIVAIRESRAVEMSIKDLSRGKAVSRGYANTARYFGHQGDGHEHVKAMSVQHFSRIEPELFKYYYYFAGPTRALVDRDALPRSPVDLITR